jgi:hypothetical protein
MNQHVVDITIIWPDDKWEQGAEQEYILSCLQGVIDSFKRNPIRKEDHKRTVINAFGRVYAEVHITPCK